MIISKFYNRNGKQAPSSDPRVITPSSIPIFILPPTLEAFANSPKPELNDSCDCWSLADEDSMNNGLKTSTSAFLNSTGNFKLVDSTKNLTTSTSLQRQKNASDPSSIFEINPKSIKKEAKNGATPNGLHKPKENTHRNSQKLKKSPPVYSNSCEVTEDESLNGTSASSKSQSSNQQSTKHMVKTLFRNGLLNMQTITNENDEVKSKENYCNLWVLHGQDEANIKSSNSNLTLNRLSVNETNKTNGPVKVLSNGNINLLITEDSSENISGLGGGDISKSASMNMIKNTTITNTTIEETTTTTSNLNNEERLQREYLRNLLKQLQQEQDAKNKLQPLDAGNQQKSGNFLDTKLKKTKRSKSETVLTIENLWNSSFGGSNANGVDKSQDPSLYNSNKNIHGRASIEHDNGKQRMNFLEVGNSIDANDAKRFSFRSLLKGNSPFIKQESSATLRRDDSSNPSRADNLSRNNESFDAATRTNSDPKRRPLLDKLMAGQSSYSISNSSSITNNSLSTLTTPTAAQSPFMITAKTASTPRANKIANPNEMFEAAARAVSETNVNKMFALNAAKPSQNDAEQPSKTGLGAELHHISNDDTNASFKRRQRYVKSNGSSNRIDAEDNDMDRVFNDYYAQLGKAKLESAFSDKKKLESSLLNENDLSAFMHEREQASMKRKSKKRRTKSAKTYRKFFTSIFKRKNSLNKQLPEIAGSIEASFKSKSDAARAEGNPDEPDASSPIQTNEFDFEIEDENGEIAKETIKLDLNYLNLNTIEREFSRNFSTAHSTADKASMFRASPRNSVRSFNTSVVSTALPKLDNKSDSFDKLKRTNSLDANHGNDVNRSLSSTEKSAPYMCSVEVSFEKLQQTPKGHILSINVKNLRVKPLIEINHVKSKFTYLTIQLTNDAPAVVSTSPDDGKQAKKSKVMAKIFKNKMTKCKFEANSKNFQKPVEFILLPDHFMNVANEATIEIQKEINPAVASLIDNDKSKGVVDNGDGKEVTQRTSLFLFSIEIHSYLPISRKTLSSTFRKKKRIFKGQCQIHENFIRATQFTKTFALTEI